MLRFVALCWSSLSVHSTCGFGFGPDVIKHKLLVQHQLLQCLCLLACARVSVLEVTCAEAGLLWKMPDVPKCYFMKSELRKEIESLNKWKWGEKKWVSLIEGWSSPKAALAGVGAVSFPSWTLGQSWSLVKFPPEVSMTAKQSYFAVEWT